MIKSKKNLLCLFFAFVALVFSTIFAVSISSKANAAPENITLVFSKLAGCQDNGSNRYVIDFTANASDLGNEFWNNNEATLIDSDGNIKKISGGGKRRYKLEIRKLSARGDVLDRLPHRSG